MEVKQTRLKEVKDKAKEIAKQVIVISKAAEAYQKEPIMKNGVAYHEAIGRLLLLCSELSSLNIHLVTESSSLMRKSRIKDNLKVLGFPNG